MARPNGLGGWSLTEDDVREVAAASGYAAPPETFTIDLATTRDISAGALDGNGRLRVLPAAFWAATTPAERAAFCHFQGAYLLPTVELVEHLRTLIGGRRAIEIGAGNGVLARALGITATDSRQQEREPTRSIYAARGWPPVRYGPDVVDCHASRAVRRFRPLVVVGAWITSRPDQTRSGDSGNPAGVDEADVLRHCDTYVLIGNEHTHADKALWDRPHDIEYPSWLYSRAMNGSREFIATWRRRTR